MSINIIKKFLVLLMLYSSASCSTSNQKFEAINEEYLNQKPIPANYLTKDEFGATIIKSEPGWTANISSKSNLTFAKLRITDNGEIFVIILNVDPIADEIIVLPLSHNETPLSVLTNKDLKEQYINKVEQYQTNQTLSNIQIHSLTKLIKENQLGVPIPKPTHIFAVAANYPSHLEYDLGIKNANEYKQELAKARPRVFLKYPLTIPPGAEIVDEPCEKLHQIIGPYDRAYYTKKIAVPGQSTTDTQAVIARIDYEAEIGAVIGRDLMWQDVEHASDEEILNAVAGYVLVNDTKARNPQVMLNILRHEEKVSKENTYRVGNDFLDERLGVWDQQTNLWWSYAASWGGVHSLGPFFVEAKHNENFPERIVIGARSFGDMRESLVPEDYLSNMLYLRQLALTTHDENTEDGLIWSLPDIVRSILAPESALEFIDTALTIKQGDIISLGTPGGTVITVKAPKVFRIVEDIAVWLDPIDWHNLFFKGDAQLYLEGNDSIFIWGTGLGFQHVELSDISKHESWCQ